MVQLELDPKFMPTGRTAEEIEFYRNRILRVAHRGKRREERKFHPISLEEALLDLMEEAYISFRQLSDNGIGDTDQWVSGALTSSLPFVQGVEGNFRSFGHFKSTMFEDIIFHRAVDRHRRFLRQQGRFNNPDSFPSKEVRKSRFNRFNGFQPTLFSPVKMREALFVDKYLSDQFMTDLANPERVLNQQLPPHIRRAVHLSVQNGFPSPKVATILEMEGFGKFTDSAVRVWLKRFRDKAGGKLPVAHPA